MPPSVPAPQVRARGALRGRLALFGPALVAAIAYVDPGNIAANTQAGASTGYALLWVVAGASLLGGFVQYLSAKLGLATGRSLPQICRDTLPRRTNVALWVQAEIVAACTDVAEFVGAVLGLHLLLGMPPISAALLTAVVSLVIVGLQQRGQRPFERAVAGLLVVVTAGFLYTSVRLDEVRTSSLIGGFRPSLAGDETALLAAGIVGATVMPHAIYLHSALTERRGAGLDDGRRRQQVKYLRIDCATGLGLAGIVNVAMLVLAAELYAGNVGSDSSLETAHALVVASVGMSAGIAFAGALVASGLASSAVGTYAGEVVMAGFIGRRIPVHVRRTVTMVPSLVVVALGLPITDTLIVTQVILSFGVPFALVPLLFATHRRDLMGALANRVSTTVIGVAACVLVVSLNVAVLLSTSFG